MRSVSCAHFQGGANRPGAGRQGWRACTSHCCSCSCSTGRGDATDGTYRTHGTYGTERYRQLAPTHLRTLKRANGHNTFRQSPSTQFPTHQRSDDLPLASLGLDWEASFACPIAFLGREFQRSGFCESLPRRAATMRQTERLIWRL